MSSREIRARIERLTKAMGERQPQGPVCRFHARACRMGANWPLPWPGLKADAELIDLFRAAHIRVGKEVGPHPRDIWQTDAHEVVPQAELDKEARELQELLVSLQARNDQIVAQLRDERDRGLS